VCAPLYKQIICWVLTSLLYDRNVDEIKIAKIWSVYDYNFLKTTSKKAILHCYEESNTKYIDM
jgi:hypothetical protein